MCLPVGHAGSVSRQLSYDDGFVLLSTVYHVTASPSPDVIEKCIANIRAGQRPILLVPRNRLERARSLAQDDHVGDVLTILSIEDFVAINVIEMSTDENRSFFEVMNEIVKIYNERLAEVETDQSLRIQLR